jgi:carboxyl-terminal processing protease
MLSGLDPHSNYLNSEQYKSLQVGTRGEFGGLGIEVGMEDGFVRVISPIDDTPAQKAGVKAGDLIVRLDETPVKGLTLSDAVKLMRGKVGTKLHLTVVRKGEDKPLKITIVRDIIKLKSVKFKLYDEHFGYIRVSNFQAKTAENLRNAISKLQQQTKNQLFGLVLDLRNNPGGILMGAVEVGDAFINKGLIVYTQGRVKDSQQTFKAAPDDLMAGAPIVVLVNGGSASASEIVAGALQDHKRAIIVGTKTFGKGSVQTILPMKNATGMKLTTARYYTPSGKSIQAKGITPDIILADVSLKSNEKTGVEVTEASLTGHLENEKTGAKKKSIAKKASDIALDDFELHQALNILKGLNVLSAK